MWAHLVFPVWDLVSRIQNTSYWDLSTSDFIKLLGSSESKLWDIPNHRVCQHLSAYTDVGYGILAKTALNKVVSAVNKSMHNELKDILF